MTILILTGPPFGLPGPACPPQPQRVSRARTPWVAASWPPVASGTGCELVLTNQEENVLTTGTLLSCASKPLRLWRDPDPGLRNPLGLFVEVPSERPSSVMSHGLEQGASCSSFGNRKPVIISQGRRGRAFWHRQDQTSDWL